MATPITITATIGAYLRDSTALPELAEASRDPELHSQFLGTMVVYSDYDMSRTWTRIGDAEIKVTLHSKDDQVQAAIKTLHQQLEEARAKFLQVQAQIMERISKLQALEYTPEPL